MRVRQNYWTLASKDVGALSVGYQSPATDDLTIINLGSQMNDAPCITTTPFAFAWIWPSPRLSPI